MVKVLVAAMFMACDDGDHVMPDAGQPDAGITGNGTATEQCWFWDGPTKCAPKCANKTLLGRPTFGPGCEIATGQTCKAENMTGPAGQGGACCLERDRVVELWACV